LLSLTPDLLSLPRLVINDNFQKKKIELAYLFDNNDSALRSLSSDAIVDLMALNIAAFRDKRVGILCLQPMLASNALTINSFSVIPPSIHHLHRAVMSQSF